MNNDPLSQGNMFGAPLVAHKAPGIEAIPTKMEEVLVGTVSKIAVRYAQETKMPDMNTVLKDLAVEGIYSYIIEDMLIIPLPIIGKGLFNNRFGQAIKRTIAKSGVSYGIDYTMKSIGKKQFQDYLLQEGLVEIAVLAYKTFVGRAMKQKAGRTDLSQ